MPAAGGVRLAMLPGRHAPPRDQEDTMTSDSPTHRCRPWRVRASWSVAVLAALALGACGAAGSAQRQGHPGDVPSPTLTASDLSLPSPSPSAATVSLAVLAALAKSSAASDGDPGVTSAEAVLTTEQGASEVMDSLPNPNEPVYLVQTKGHFTAYRASVPPGMKLPTGDYNILEIDASSGEVIGAGVSTADADLSSLGTVTILHL
jgi:hypothetical protein